MAYKVTQGGRQIQADLDKIEGIEEGAQVNVQADWNVNDPTSDAYIKNKPNGLTQIQSDWSQSDNSSVDFIKNKPTNVSAFTNDAGYLTQHQDVSSLADGAEYDNNEKKIYLKHGNVRLANPIDATAFIKDGMVDTVVISNGYLVVTFNTDSGKEPISLSLSDIFNPANYYTKSQVDAAIQNIDVESLVEVSWSELKTMRNGGGLKEGNYYRITDYNCTTTQKGTQSAGHQFDIVLLALSEDKLAEEGWAMMNESNVYDVTFADGVTKKCWIYQDDIYDNIVDCSTLIGTGAMSIGEEDDNDVILNKTNRTAICTSVSSSLHEPDLTYNYFQNSNLSAWKVWYCLDNDKSRFAWADDREGYLISGQSEFGIWDNQLVLRAPGWDFDDLYGWEIVGTEDGIWTKTLDINVGQLKLYNNSGDLMVVATVSSANKVYNGRGVIYRLIDEWNNDCPYDFKNIMYHVNCWVEDGGFDDGGEEQWVYTFVASNEIYKVISEASSTFYLNDFNITQIGARDNKIYNCYNDRYILPFISMWGYELHGSDSPTINGNIFKENCTNIFVSNCSYSLFDNNCDDIIGTEAFSNCTFGRACHNLVLGRLRYANYGNGGDELVVDDNYVHTDNNYTTAEKTKLSGVAVGAQVNVQSDWNQSDSSADDYVKNKPTIDATPTQNSGNLVSSGGVYSALEDKLEYYELTDDTNLSAIWSAYMGGGTITDQQAFNAACEYLLGKMYDVDSDVVFLINDHICTNSYYEGFPTTSPSYNPTDACSVFFEFVEKYQGAVLYNVLGVSRANDGVTWGRYGYNDQVELLPAKTLSNYCPIIEDTRSSAVASITGVAPFSTLEDGQRIVLKVNKAIPNSPTITLTLSGGNDTSAIPAYSAYQDTVTTVWGNAIKTGMYVELIYESANNRWMMVGNRDSNTTYPNMTQVNIGAGTSTSANVISPKLLHDNAYIVEETYSSGSLKANKMYDFGTVSSALTIPTLDATNDLVSNALNFYALRFIAGADNLSITFPTGVIVDDEPTINTDDYVEIMINLYVENSTNHFYASIKVWRAQ